MSPSKQRSTTVCFHSWCILGWGGISLTSNKLAGAVCGLLWEIRIPRSPDAEHLLSTTYHLHPRDLHWVTEANEEPRCRALTLYHLPPASSGPSLSDWSKWGAQMQSTYSLPLTTCILGTFTEWLKQMRWKLAAGGRRAERTLSEAPGLHRVSALVLQGPGTGGRTKTELLHNSENQASEDNTP